MTPTQKNVKKLLRLIQHFQDLLAQLTRELEDDIQGSDSYKIEISQKAKEKNVTNGK